MFASTPWSCAASTASCGAADLVVAAQEFSDQPGDRRRRRCLPGLQRRKRRHNSTIHRFDVDHDDVQVWPGPSFVFPSSRGFPPDHGRGRCSPPAGGQVGRFAVSLRTTSVRARRAWRPVSDPRSGGFDSRPPEWRSGNVRPVRRFHLGAPRVVATTHGVVWASSCVRSAGVRRSPKQAGGPCYTAFRQGPAQPGAFHRYRDCHGTHRPPGRP